MSEIHADKIDADLKIFVSGATRSRDVEEFRFDLAPACATRREAKIWAEGAETHGDHNWKKGFPIHVCLNHMEYHLNKYKGGDREEDHLAKMAVNAAMAMFFEEACVGAKLGDSATGLVGEVQSNMKLGGRV